MLTRDQEQRIRQAINECDRYIAKEGPRAADLRPEWAQKALDHAHAHKARMQAMFDSGVWAL